MVDSRKRAFVSANILKFRQGMFFLYSELFQAFRETKIFERTFLATGEPLPTSYNMLYDVHHAQSRYPYRPMRLEVFMVFPTKLYVSVILSCQDAGTSKSALLFIAAARCKSLYSNALFNIV